MKKVTWFISLILLLFTLENTYADDTEIFSGGVVNVPPNVLIIFDTSGSMDDQIASSIYYPSNDYSNGLGGVGYIYDTEKVYYVWKEPSHPQEFPIYRVFTDTTAEVGCFEAGEALETLGHWMGYIENSSPFNCGTTNAETLATGNYLNFLQTPETDWDEKIDVAKQVIEDLLVSVEDTAVRFGLMRYDEVKNQGGRILAEIGSTDDQIKLQMDDNDFYPHGATPIAECLAEAGLYFAGQQSWADNSITYTSPVQWRCQKNYIILMTDGCSYADEGDAHYTKDILFTKADYLNGSPIGDYDGDTVDPQTDVNGGTHWLDDVAKFLYDEDILIDPATDNAGVSFDDEYFQQQNIVTYTIGFATGTDDLLLQRAADSNHGHGAYYSAEDSSELATAFSTIVGIILSHNASFIAPVVPVSKQNSIFSGNTVYLSLFKPMNDSGFWYGNIKKFGIDSHGLILQKNGTLATDQNGQILDDASSCWQDSSLDGSTTEAGGAGSAMLNQTTRNFYTYKSGNSYDLTSSVNAFSTGNADITAALLGVTSDHRDDLINFLTARGDYALGGQFEREWVLGDILHSKPATMYDGNNTLIFLGANDGFLHVFVDDDKGTDSTDTLGDDTLSEAWCFVPWDILPDLHLIQDSTAHHYYVDGSPMLYRAGNNQYVAFGMRRGGNKYYSINIGQY
ncbi:MAG: hypothetical protein JW920_00705, partial [Deltaproteobacteria bacterium]|nr:hypothetical protein [Deltaproteobacteria bacterium]